MKNAAAQSEKSTTAEEDARSDESTWIEQDENDPSLDDLRTSQGYKVKHGAPALIEYDEQPRSSRRETRSNTLCAAVDISGRCPTAIQSSRRRFPMKFLTDFAGLVLDGETGELLEYRHLIKRPKYKDECGYSFGNEIGRLAQGMPGRNNGTNTIFFVDKCEVPADRWPDVA